MGQWVEGRYAYDPEEKKAYDKSMKVLDERIKNHVSVFHVKMNAKDRNICIGCKKNYGKSPWKGDTFHNVVLPKYFDEEQNRPFGREGTRVFCPQAIVAMVMRS